MTEVDQLVDVFHRVQCAAVLPIGILFRRQIGLENRFEYQNCCRFRHPVTDSGYSQRPLLPIRLGYIYPPHRFWLIGSAFQFLRQFVQPSLHPVCLDVLEGLIIYSVSLAKTESAPQDADMYSLFDDTSYEERPVGCWGSRLSAFAPPLNARYPDQKNIQRELVF